MVFLLELETRPDIINGDFSYLEQDVYLIIQIPPTPTHSNALFPYLWDSSFSNLPEFGYLLFALFHIFDSLAMLPWPQVFSQRSLTKQLSP